MFLYRAADLAGRVVDGSLEAESEAAVAVALEHRSLTPLHLRRVKSRHVAVAGVNEPTKICLKLRNLLEFTRQLKLMLASGITVLATLALLRQRATGGYQRLLDRVAGDIQSGSTLSEALAAHPRTFDPFYLGTIRAGEAAGVHTQALDELIRYYERRAKLRREITGALTYPAIVVAALIGACFVLLIFVIPQFQTVFASTGVELPLATQILLAVSAFLHARGWWVLGGVLALATTAWLVRPLPRARSAFGHALARVPFIGHILYLSSVVQFSRMLALLEHAGLPLLESLRVVTEMLMPGPVRTLIAEVRRQVATGTAISDAVADTHVLPPLVEQMIVVGEQTGRIDETLSAAADHYEEDVRIRILRLTTALEPLLTILLSSLVLGVALAIFLPMWRMNSALLKH
jgi:type II secretory pathway component PulF